MNGPLVIDIETTKLTDADIKRITNPLVGMVILFARNYENPEQLRALTCSIKGVAPDVLIAVDQEGGRVQRFLEGFIPIPPMADFGKVYEVNPRLAIEAAIATGFILAGELRGCGVDVTFAPCVDIDFGRSTIIGHRAFSSNPDVVTVLALAITAGFRKAGMTNCAKHFPGHGFVAADSHLELPTDDRSFEMLAASDLLPYRVLKDHFDAVMMAHVAYPAVDNLPASFSSTWIRYLRDELSFNGTIFSDDLSMKGASSLGNIIEKAQKALSAGCDALIVCNKPEDTDTLLSNLTWEKTPAFSERTFHLKPKGTFVTKAEFNSSEAFKAALQTLEALKKAREGI